MNSKHPLSKKISSEGLRQGYFVVKTLSTYGIYRVILLRREEERIFYYESVCTTVRGLYV